MALIWFFTISSGHRSLEVQEETNNMSYLVQNLIQTMNLKDPVTHDVVLLNLGLYKSSKQDVHQAFIKAVPNENFVTSPKVREVSRNYSIRKAAVIVIVSDVFNVVSSCHRTIILKASYMRIMSHFFYF